MIQLEAVLPSSINTYANCFLWRAGDREYDSAFVSLVYQNYFLVLTDDWYHFYMREDSANISYGVVSQA